MNKSHLPSIRPIGIENKKRDTPISIEYGLWLGGMNWTHIATIRPHYQLTMYNSNKLMERLSKQTGIYRLFFALEKDINPKHLHLHLLLNADEKLKRKDLVKKIGVNPKVVSYFQPVLCNKAVSIYCAKHITKNFSHYNFY